MIKIVILFLKKYNPGWVGGWVDIKTILRIAYSNQKANYESVVLYCKHFTLSSVLCKY